MKRSFLVIFLLVLCQISLAQSDTGKRTKTEAFELITKFRNQIISGEKSFCSIALFHSEDPGTRSNCGEFELISRGTFVPEFDAAAFKLAVGEMSEPFLTEFGYHILMLTEKKGDQFSGRHILISFTK